jgi:ElaB/YqjD/DUF883 family membrane-anchored ribosome-binding protein
MGDTLEELGARLNPQRLKQQAKDKVHDATIGRVQTMAQNTIDKASGAGRKVTDIVRENPIPAALIAAGVSWLAWSSRRGKVVDNGGAVSERATEMTKSAASSVAETAREKTDRVSSAIRSNPVPLGIAAAALGLAAGYALPSTEKEGELVGEKRDELVDKARELVQEKKESVKRVAERVVSEAKTTATQAAREEGLTGSA